MSQNYQEEMSGKECFDGTRIFQMHSLFFLYMFDVSFGFMLYRYKRESLAYCRCTAHSQLFSGLFP